MGWEAGRIWEGTHAKKKRLSRGAIPKYKGKRGGHVKYFSKTLKWHNVLINEVLEFKRKKRAEEKAKESRGQNINHT